MVSETRCDDGVEGEIWVSGTSVALGYFGREQASRDTFAAMLDGKTWLRTGDLGCVAEGEMYVTGRAKDTVVKNGVNYAAEDIEHTVQQLPSCVVEFQRLRGFRVRRRQPGEARHRY